MASIIVQVKITKHIFSMSFYMCFLVFTQFVFEFHFMYLFQLFTEDPSSVEKQGLVGSPWSMWRPIPTSLFSGHPFPATDRSIYSLYGSLLGLSTSHFALPPVAFHPLLAANNVNNMRLREGMPPTSVYNAEAGATAAAQLHYPTALYRYHPYLTTEKLAAAQKPASSSAESSPTLDTVRP